MPSPEPVRPSVVPIIPALAGEAGFVRHATAVDVDQVRFVVVVGGDAVPLAEYLCRHPECRQEVLARIRAWLDAR